MSVDFDSVAAVIATLTDAAELQKRLDVLRSAALAAEQKIKQAEVLAEKYANADRLRTEAATALVKIQEKIAEVRRREEAIAPAEHEIAAKQHLLKQREEAVAHRERAAEARHARLGEIIRAASA
jgi:vacuolar-type H+-ATPase subunit I/STV1